VRRNLELKAPLSDVLAASRVAHGLGASDLGELRQVDTYFSVERGRLKLREIEGGIAELIFYHRPDEGAARWSDFWTSPAPDAGSTKALLTAALGIRGTVKKYRRIFTWIECRIHLDEVEDLGSFLELEVLSTGDEIDDQARMAKLVEAFRVDVTQASYGLLRGFASALTSKG